MQIHIILAKKPYVASKIHKFQLEFRIYEQKRQTCRK